MGKRNWMLMEHGESHAVLQIIDPDGRAGYPGNCTVTATYTIRDGGVLSVVYETVSDKPTIANVCQHSYFNLDGAETALGHEISIAADYYLPTNEQQIPSGEIRSVDGTVFDLRQPTPMRRKENGEQVLYDHNFCLSPERRAKRKIARAYSPASDIALEVHTTEPGVQFYSAFKLNVPVPASTAATMAPSPVSAWKRRYGPMPSITRIFRTRSCGRAKPCGRKPIISSRKAELAGGDQSSTQPT